ncbi:Rieske (2Fe-2S) iron-sulfur domain protein [Thiorhodococcus drewsii AZ1]|uniref:Rieske (2Fe-2S) iron-sulfur domain protein n=1 Tax=Thiorhodococcus drewsii AZ1 TaxID=765913 RepID=G2DZL4_9GAMM|nr:Rieske 2Fe-2S domain-containing protein [Thiorhodococcus drewsii]EGV32241.1 Rieske (2Fe-2S) iron-sulfur domain protein [Thiorhodococcus drewsii AZ1]
MNTIREKRKLAVCASADLDDQQHRIVPLLFKGEPHTAILLRHEGQVYAYLNQCVHMVRRLDCMHDAIFDEGRERLRCSMHGIVYDPTTGESLSVLCAGEKLEALRSTELDGQVYITDKRVKRST